MRILIIEDEQKIAHALEDGLVADGYSVEACPSGEEGFYRLSTETFDLLILDLGLPGRDGLDILRSLRRQGMSIPVLILTARDKLEDRVGGLESGADDYLVKPFAVPELLARVHALLRRRARDAETRLRVEDLELDLSTRRVTRSGVPLSLTLRELDLLEYFLRNAGRVVTREMLVRDVWQAPVRATPLDNVIDVHMTHLRKKIDGGTGPRLLHTVRGVGFILGPGDR
jgi:DNA-binding response OmpR family regulator